MRSYNSDGAKGNTSVSEPPLITISIPVLNEEENLAPLYQQLCGLSDRESAYRFEFLFTDNASTDETFERLADLAFSDKRIRVLRFSRNFGFQQSILTNYNHARGVAAIQLDADMQDPPEMISEFLRKWEEGYKVVYGIRKGRKESFLMNSARNFYYKLVSWLSHTDLPRNVGDFRLVDRLILDKLSDTQEQTPYLRGLIANMGYPQIGIPYNRDARQAGDSKFGLFKLIELGLDGITSQSVRPLRLITMFGFFISGMTALVILVYLGYFLFSNNDMPSGFMTLMLMGLGSIGLNSLFLGLLGEYIGRIFNNTRGLPISIIEHRIEHRIKHRIEPLAEEPGQSKKNKTKVVATH